MGPSVARHQREVAVAARVGSEVVLQERVEARRVQPTQVLETEPMRLLVAALLEDEADVVEVVDRVEGVTVAVVVAAMVLDEEAIHRLLRLSELERRRWRPIFPSRSSAVSGET